MAGAAVVSIAFFGMVVIIVLIGANMKNRRVRTQAEVQSKLIDKFGSAPDLLTFLQSPAGRSFMTGVEQAPRMMAREQIVSAFRRAIVTGFLGLAFLALCIPEDVRNEGFMIAGALLLALGVAFLLSAVASLKLSKSLGLVNGHESENPTPMAPPRDTTLTD